MGSARKEKLKHMTPGYGISQERETKKYRIGNSSKPSAPQLGSVSLEENAQGPTRSVKVLTPLPSFDLGNKVRSSLSTKKAWDFSQEPVELEWAARRAFCPGLVQRRTCFYVGRDRWLPPHANAIKVIFDGAWSPSTSHGGIWVIARDDCGTWRGGTASPIFCNSALVAEAAAALYAVSYAITRDFSKSFSTFRLKWVPKSANRAAHKPATIGLRAMELQSWVIRPPLSLVGVLNSDGLPCPPVGSSLLN
ncbi:hypothetical protein L3X38_044734 [Prunus dulcis]|uniref:RNase H type-1 domain-containing protein n=1 Tax=Prunus dulcis TaxID=3755 RepID=A0AAD4UZI6_PRUDU|nr:hypothetical protein L3X38_044734 [Prunus dulcis]